MMNTKMQSGVLYDRQILISNSKLGAFILPHLHMTCHLKGQVKCGTIEKSTRSGKGVMLPKKAEFSFVDLSWHDIVLFMTYLWYDIYSYKIATPSKEGGVSMSPSHKSTSRCQLFCIKDNSNSRHV